jgi:hypothetical protein
LKSKGQSRDSPFILHFGELSAMEDAAERSPKVMTNQDDDGDEEAVKTTVIKPNVAFKSIYRERK